MARYREEVYAKWKKKKPAKGDRPSTFGSDIDRARAVRAEYFAKPLSVRKAIAKAQASQSVMF